MPRPKTVQDKIGDLGCCLGEGLIEINSTLQDLVAAQHSNITSVVIDSSNNLVVTFDDGRTVTYPIPCTCGVHVIDVEYDITNSDDHKFTVYFSDATNVVYHVAYVDSIAEDLSAGEYTVHYSDGSTQILKVGEVDSVTYDDTSGQITVTDIDGTINTFFAGLWVESTGAHSLVPRLQTGNVAVGNYALAGGEYSEASGLDSISYGGKGDIGDGTGTIKANIASGDYSVAFGLGNTASEIYSIAMGRGSEATEEEAIAIGHRAKATAHGAHAINNSTASGELSFASGHHTEASGKYSHTGGQENIASGVASVAFGYETIALGTRSFAIGYNTTASGTNAFATGESNTATSMNSISIGRYSKSEGISSFAGGLGANISKTSLAHGTGAFAFYYQSDAMVQYGALANYSVVLGGENNKTETGVNSVVIGGKTNTASGENSFSNGLSNSSTGKQSVSFGSSNEAQGDNSFTIGSSNISSGLNSVAIGNSTKSSGAYSFAGGQGNSTYQTEALGIGAFAFYRQSNTSNQYGATGDYSVVIGGENNKASGKSSITVGGENVKVSDDYSFAGGYGESTIYPTTAAGICSFAFYENGHGAQYGALANNSVVLGGVNGLVESTAIQSGIFCGFTNKIKTGSQYSVINGGYENIVDADYSVVIGGSGNEVDGDYSAVIGGSGLTNSIANSVMVPTLRLENLSSAPASHTDGQLYFDGTHLYIYISGSAVQLD